MAAMKQSLPQSEADGISTRMLAVLWVPRFRLQAVLLNQASNPGSNLEAHGRAPSPALHGTVALVDGSSVRGLLLEATLCAERLGVAAGMAPAQALARCPQLELAVASETSEEWLAGRLLHFAGTLSPRVERQAPNRCLLDLRGLGIRDWNLWAQEALERLRHEFGMEAALGVAPQAGLAWCAARRAFPVRVVDAPEVFIEELTFAELEVSSTLQQQLEGWGVYTLGELLRLPKQGALERLGPEAAPLWELARDTRECVLRLESFPEVLQLSQDLEHPVQTLAPVIFILNRMIEQLASRMRLLHRVAAVLELKLFLENAPPYERHFGLPTPSREEAVMLRVLETHLEALTLEAALVGVSLKIREVLPSSQQLALFENPLRDPNRFGETLARLEALAGENRMGIPVPAHTHRPGAFHLLDPSKVFGAPPEPKRSPHPAGPQPTEPQHGLPLRRFRPALEALVHLKQHRPVRIHAGNISGAVLDCYGPYRLSGTWWEAGAWRREEWDIHLGGGAGGLYRLACEHGPPQVWTLEGCYDAHQWAVRRPPVSRTTFTSEPHDAHQ